MKKIILIFLSFAIFLFSFAKESFSIQNGMTFDVSFDYGFEIVDSDLFNIKQIPVLPDINNPVFKAFNFNQNLNYMYGGNIFFGYMMENGVSASFGIGYHQSEIEHQDDKESNLKPIIVSGMINLDYMLDLGFILYPYLSVGAGIGRIDMKGKINGGDDVVLEFKNLKKNKFVYQAGAGILIKNFGIGYKFFGMMDLEDTDTFNDLKVSINNTDIPSENFKFDTFENKNHIVTAFMKFVI